MASEPVLLCGHGSQSAWAECWGQDSRGRAAGHARTIWLALASSDPGTAASVPPHRGLYAAASCDPFNVTITVVPQECA